MKALTSRNLIIHLVKCGYRYCKPQCRTWNSAFLFRYENSVLCILFRKNGIDLRYYEKYNNEILINKNIMSMHGGELFRNHYNESTNLITQKIKVISSCFTKGRLMNEAKTEDGRSYLLNAEYQNIREKSKKNFNDLSTKLKDDKDWRDIYEYVEKDCGGYWGEGVWS